MTNQFVKIGRAFRLLFLAAGILGLSGSFQALSAAEVAVASDVPGVLWSVPFLAILLGIAILPLLPATHHAWERNSNKLLVSLALSAVTLGYY
ncbi:MAG: hypothetical protein ACKO0V_04345, partial [bacterium]